MINEQERKRIIALIRQEVVPAIGCTEPVAVALCVAKAPETLGVRSKRIQVMLSANVLKNAMGALVGRSEYKLEVLKDCTQETLEQGRLFIAEKRVTISLKENISEKLYIEVNCKSGKQKATAVISGEHTTFVYIVVP